MPKPSIYKTANPTGIRRANFNSKEEYLAAYSLAYRRLKHIEIHGIPFESVSRTCKKCQFPMERAETGFFKCQNCIEIRRFNRLNVSCRPIPTLSQKDIQRFHSGYEQVGDCWVWKMSKCQEGYGKFSIKGKYYPAHRISVQIHSGYADPSKIVMHSCDSPYCVNPAHLILGSNDQNHLDSVAKGRVANSDFMNKKLVPTDGEVATMLKLISLGVSKKALSTKFGASIPTIESKISEIVKA